MTKKRLLLAAADPVVHALIAAVVVAPLGRGPVLTAVAAGTLIDVDHPIAARSARPAAMTSLAARPRSHNLLATLGVGTIGALAGGPRHGWAAFAGLTSHLLRDASDDAAPTPLLWPWSPPRQISRRAALVGITALTAGSWALSLLEAGPSVPSAAAAGDGAGTTPPRTA
jgi:LexA-binding, inner membrane-associated putative hydrolase